MSSAGRAIPVAQRSRARLCDRSLAGTAVSNPARERGCLSLVNAVRCQVEVSSRAVLQTAVCLTECD